MPEEERGLPSNTYAEKICLATCWCSKHKGVTLEIATKLSTDDFVLEANRHLFSAIQDLSRKGVAVDEVTLHDYLLSRGNLERVGGLSYIVSLADGMPDIPNYASYVDILKKLTARRRIIFLANEAMQRSFLGQEEPQKIVGSLTANLRDAVDDTERDGPESVAHYIETYPDGLDHLLNPSLHEPGILTGFKGVDEATDGFHNDEIWVIGGTARAGKTAMALNIARHVAGGGDPVAIFSLEMSKRSLFYRLICTEAGVSFMRFRRGQISELEEKKLAEASSVIYELPIYMDARSGISPSEYHTRIESMIEKFHIKLSILDYIQIMKANNTRLSGDERLSSICLDIQDITKRVHVPIILLSQLSRDAPKTKRKPELSDFRGSGAIEQIADVGGLIFREELYNRDNDALRGKAVFILDKIRNGESAHVPMRYIGWRMQFEDATEEEKS
jgi:replicative DNA helicase